MEDESTSMISNSNDTNPPNRNNNKRARVDDDDDDHVDTNDNNTIASSSFAKFKGVVSHQNGHWGAQIYANHQRIWLGTFKSEKAAAMAYDSAAIKLRSGDTNRNFPWTSLTLQEPKFQKHYTPEAILNMIKDGTYQSKFLDFITTQSQLCKQVNLEINTSTSDHNHDQIRVHGDSHFLCRQLFQKELTPSDVGKLNRLVVPKKYAVKYFPYISEDNHNHNHNNNNNHVEENRVEDIELVFYDKLMRPWKFRYCYWRSSQSFVFTRGWNRFVKENSLKADDVITFYSCEQCNVNGILREQNGQSFCLIDHVTHKGPIINDSNKKCVDNIEGININYDHNHCDKLLNILKWEDDHHKFDQGSSECKYKEAKVSNNVERGKGFRLFGVDIK